MAYTQQSAVIKKEKNALAAALLSFLFTGSGQVYNGETGKGIGILIGAIIGYFIFVIPGVLVILYGVYDAYSTAQKMNKGEIPYVEVSNGKVIGFIIAEIVIFVIVFIILAALIYEIGGSPSYYY
jgi:TM2 domain-containing membrane protein YozV